MKVKDEDAINDTKRSSSPMEITQKLGNLTFDDHTSHSFPPPISTNSAAEQRERGRDVELFLRAGELERKGEISDAIKLYEQAYRLNPDVDRLASTLVLSSNGTTGAEESLVSSQETAAVTAVKFQICISGLLEEVQQALKDSEIPDYQPLGVPEEVLRRILTWTGLLHAPSLEACAKTCRRMFLLSRNQQIWRQMYMNTRATIHPEMIPTRCPISWRHSYFMEPRARTDGIYICKISYFRPGMTDGAFFQPVHLVTYYRYLRFYPQQDGCTAVLLVTTEGPKTAIELLKKPLTELSSYIPFGYTAEELVVSKWTKRSGAKPRLRDPTFKKTNLFIGRYFRIAPNDDEFHLCLYDPQAGHDSLFDMTLSVTSSKSNAGGGSTMITCNQYSSLSKAIAPDAPPRVFPFDVKDWGKFVFSRVRSYVS